MTKREARKLKAGDLVYAPGIGIYRNDPRKITEIIFADKEFPDAPTPLVQLEGEPETRMITYRHLQIADTQ